MNNRKVDVLTIRQHFPSSIAPTSSYWVYEQIRDLSEKGISFVAIAPQPYIPNVFRAKSKYPNPLPYNDVFKGITVLRPIHFRIPKYKFYSITNKFLSNALLNSAKGNRFKLIHAHFGNDGIAAMKLKQKFGVPLITSFYGYDLSDELDTLSPYYKKLQKVGDLFLALSQDMKNDLLNLGFPEKRIKIHHLGINLSEMNSFYKQPTKKSVDTFLIAARFSERKGIHDSILAFSKILLKYPNKELRIIGNGTYKKELLSLVKKLNISKSVKFIDNFRTNNPRQTVLTEVSKCDVFILTSYTTVSGSKEGTPLVLMEAHALGKPCIGTLHAGIPEIVLDNKTGMLIKERDVEGIANAMSKFIENPSLVVNYGENGREHIKKEFNNSVQNNKLFEIYKGFISGS